MPLIYLSCAWLLGSFLGTKFNLSPVSILIGFLPFPLLFLTRHYRKPIVLISLSLMTLLAATAYSYSSLYDIDESDLRFHNDQSAEIRGMVARDPEIRDKTTQLHLKATAIKLDDEWQTVEGIALLMVPRYPAYQYGDVLRVTGKLETPPQLGDFDYRGYLAHQGIYTTMHFPKIEIEARGKGFPPLAGIYSIRNHLAQTLSEVLPEPQASLAQGIILGIRGNIPSSTNTNFVRTGTAHLLAISGLHLSIIAGIMLSIGIWLFGRRHYLYVWLALSIIWLYAILTGLHPPVVRGTIMATLFLFAELLGRQRRAITALTFAAAVMVGLSPYILGDAAFQMSFLAMTGLVLLFPTLQNLGRKAVKSTLGEEGALVSIANVSSDSLSASLAAVIAVWPLVAYYFGIVSFIGPFATFLALPALPGAIITGVLTGLLSFIALPVAQVAGWLTWLFISYILLVANGLAAVPLSYLKVGSVEPTLLWAYYSIIGFVVFVGSRKSVNPIAKVTNQLKSGVSKSFNLASRVSKKWVLPPLVLMAILVSYTASTLPDRHLHVSFLDIGQGDAILLQQGTQQILIDGGPSPQKISLALSKQMPFWDRTIDLVVLTHPDADHLAGLVAVLQRFQVKQVLYPDLTSKSSLYAEWQNLIKAKKIKSITAIAGQQIDFSGAIIRVLNPKTTYLVGTEADEDNKSLVLRLSQGKVSFLLTADIHQEAEFELMADRAELNSTVLKVAHHGAKTSTTAEFLAVVNPQLAVISVGADNKFGHPSAEVLARLKARLSPENIYRTDEQGTIEFITDGERLWVKMER